MIEFTVTPTRETAITAYVTSTGAWVAAYRDGRIEVCGTLRMVDLMRIIDRMLGEVAVQETIPMLAPV